LVEFYELKDNSNLTKALLQRLTLAFVYKLLRELQSIARYDYRSDH